MSSTYKDDLESKGFLPFHLDHLTPHMIQKAKQELNETESTRSSSIKQLRELIKKEKNFQCRMDDEFLLQYLRARKFNVKKAFDRLQTFYQMVSKSFSDVFLHMDEESAKKAIRTGFMSHLPYRDKDGAAIVGFKMSNWNTEELDAFSVMNCCGIVIQSAIDYPATQVCGVQLLIDCKGTSVQHMTCLTPRLLYLVSKGLRGAMAIRFKGVHLINASAIFRYLWAIINVFLTEKLRKRIHFHDNNLENLHKYIPKEILPTEYGGDCPNFDPHELGVAEMENFLPKYFQIMHDGYRKN
ncbi:retinaldehyde-binding protein 1-like [Argiope bruennichi]|uniref:retinaldehyde-binding protein 1-like n=1 Tax=Argiope bruennichi TaxID=94029 RepID=UPI002493EF98|nr:retinaldehyde-binding protein 1-like [Argiope bruennichi]XP_055946301.1 retinaldehyde-binding protein 1-like [Argiope bruennichi]